MQRRYGGAGRGLAWGRSATFVALGFALACTRPPGSALPGPGAADGPSAPDRPGAQAAGGSEAPAGVVGACADPASLRSSFSPGPVAALAVPPGTLVTVQAHGGGGSGSFGVRGAVTGGRGGYATGTFWLVRGGTLAVEVGEGGGAGPVGTGNGGAAGACAPPCGGAGGSSSHVRLGTQWLVEAGGGAGAFAVDDLAAPGATGGGVRDCDAPGGKRGAPTADVNGGGGGGWCGGNVDHGGSSHVDPSALSLGVQRGGGAPGGSGGAPGGAGLVTVCWLPSDWTVSGTVAGLSGSGLVLATPGLPDLAVRAGANSFTFTGRLQPGSLLAVDVARQPSGPPQTCTVAGGSGTVGRGDVTGVSVSCSDDPGVAVSPASAAVEAGATLRLAATVAPGIDPAVAWSVLEGDAGGIVSVDGLYTAPQAPGTYHVVATSGTDPSRRATAEVTVSASCWRLLAVDRVRVAPRPGEGAAMVGGTIQGSNDGATNGFVVLATLDAAPPDGALSEIAFANATPYRWVKYYGPPGSHGQVAEVEFFSGAVRLAGAGFGTAGSRSGNPWANALDGDPATFFDAATPSDGYVGLDLAAGHVVEAPVFSPPPGTYPAPQAVGIASATPDASIRYSTDGSDPAAGGLPYEGPVAVGAVRTTLRAVATASCSHPSAEASGLYVVGGGGGVLPPQASLHVGNSLTDTIDGWLLPVASAGGVVLDYARYTIPGIGTWAYHDDPTSGFGVDDVRATVRTKRLDHVSFQPFKNMPCVPTGHADGATGLSRSDAVNMAEAWDDQVAVNPAVQMWVFQAWPATPTEGFLGCITGGAGEWMRDPAIWSPPVPSTWDDAVRNQIAYGEAVRDGLAAMRPDRPPPYVVPAGLALLALKQAVESGTFPGLAPDAFWPTFFSRGGTDNHLTSEGRWYVTLVFYSVMFQKDPAGLPHAGTALTDAQAAALQSLAWRTVTEYPRSGVGR
jgi:hypothetical protein